jgi:FkbM family methyltransferase
MNQTLDYFLRALPWKQQIVDWGAQLRPGLRSELSGRLLSAVARRTGDAGLIKTNMGIDQRYCCLIPRSHIHVLFGKPDLYAGERGPLELAVVLSQQSDAFVDIGAHVGYFTFYVRRRLDTSKPIYYFEPDPDLYELLDRNVRSNLLVNVHGFKEAVGSQAHVATFYKNLSDSSSGSLETTFLPMHHVEPIEVKVTTYSDFAQRTGLRNVCVKVDVEGAEQQFIDGAAAQITSISSLIMEVLGPAVKAGFIQHMISNAGFQAYYINDYTLEHSPDGCFVYSLPQYNWLFCRKEPNELRALLRGSKFKIAVGKK